MGCLKFFLLDISHSHESHDATALETSIPRYCQYWSWGETTRRGQVLEADGEKAIV